jgi:hypothetical protein
MLQLLRGAVYAQLAEHYQLPGSILERVQKMARDREPDKISTYLQDQSISIKNTREDAKIIRQVLEAIRTVDKDVNGPEDTGTLLANYEDIMRTPFPKPAWMSMMMNKVEM